MIAVNSHFMAIKASWVPHLFKHSDQLWASLSMFYIQNVTANILPTMYITKMANYQIYSQYYSFTKKLLWGTVTFRIQTLFKIQRMTYIIRYYGVTSMFV